MSGTSVSIVIVNWNSKVYLRECLDSLSAGTAGVPFDVTVVDSGSFDGCATMLKQSYPWVRFIQSPSNIGFARCNNAGAAGSSAHVLLFLNPDTKVASGALAALYHESCRLPRCGAIGCRLLNGDGTLQASCVQPIPTILNQLCDLDVLQRSFPGAGLWTSARTFHRAEQPVEVDVVSGACMMLPRAAFQSVGGFSEDYFMYAEDLDLCWKLRRAGFTNYYVPTCAVTHYGGGSSKQGRSQFSEVMTRESVYRLLRKFRGGPYGAGYRWAMAGAAAVRLGLLAVWLPAAALRGRIEGCRIVARKWHAVLRWSIGLESWVAQYDRIAPGGDEHAAMRQVE
jgi:GT2 family glycosyltransferase